jgi:hypothetical protein
MKKALKILCICLGIMALIISYPAYRVYDFQKYYGEAEPLVELVWPLAIESSEFASIHGRRPYDLKEIDLFSTAHDFSALGKYRPELHKDGEVYFRMRVNKRYSFIIDQNYTPQWDAEK